MGVITPGTYDGKKIYSQDDVILGGCLVDLDRAGFGPKDGFDPENVKRYIKLIGRLSSWPVRTFWTQMWTKLRSKKTRPEGFGAGSSWGFSSIIFTESYPSKWEAKMREGGQPRRRPRPDNHRFMFTLNSKPNPKTCRKEIKAMKRLKAGWVMMAGLCLILAIGFPVWAADVIKIGVIGPMNFVQGVKDTGNGATMAAEEDQCQGRSPGWLKENDDRVGQGGLQRVSEISRIATNAMERLILRPRWTSSSAVQERRRSWPCKTLPWDYKKDLYQLRCGDPELCERVAKDYKKYSTSSGTPPSIPSSLGQTSFIHLGTVAR